MVGDNGSMQLDACIVGETRACSCAEPEMEGVQECIFDFRSPTRGLYGPCTDCKHVEPSPDDSCVRGAVRQCTCETGELGLRVCLFDPSTPMLGTFSDCRNCDFGATDFDGGV